jgi:hypothetical protein
MTVSTIESKPQPRSACPLCGHRTELRPRNDWIKMGLGILALVAVLLMLVPLGITCWKACVYLLSDKESHSILFYPLEDWTRY